jgi:predicted nuclease of predicted toxin-antitoxin system
MAYRILADENIERATVNYLRKLGHDVERLDDVEELGLGAGDESIVRYAREHDRLILTQDDDFFAELDIETMAGVLFQRDQTLSTRDVDDAVHEMSQYLDQSDIVLEYVIRSFVTLYRRDESKHGFQRL